MKVAPILARKRILYAITKANWGGAQRYVFDLATAAQARGDAVAVAAGGDGELLDRLRARGVQVFPIAAWGRDVNLQKELSALQELGRAIRAFRPDVVHVNSSKAGLAALAARFAGVRRIVFTIHGWAWNERRPLWQKAIIAFLYWLTLLLCHRAIAVSEAVKRQARFLPFLGRRIAVIHNGVHEPAFVSREDARRALAPNATGAFWIGTIAELHPVKGLDVLIAAFTRFRSDYPESELVVMGEGEERARLERLIETERVGDRARLAGHIPDASRYLRALDIFVLPSRSEGLAYVLLEAGMASLPVVATDVGGIPEVIEDQATGLLVPYGDPDALADALRALARDAQLRDALGTALRGNVERAFSLEKMVRDTFAQYR